MIATPTMFNGGPMRSGSTVRSCCEMRFDATSIGSRPRATISVGLLHLSKRASKLYSTSPTGGPPMTGQIGQLMQRGEIWFAATPGGDRPVLVLTRDPVADRIGSVVVAALTRTQRGLVSELKLTTADGVPTDSVVNFDNIHTIPRSTFRRKVATLSPARLADACRTLQAATGC